MISPRPSRFALRTLAVIGLATIGLVFPGIVAADGLIYKLPADGVSATYKLTMESGDREVSGFVTVSSVGETDEGGTKGRWIELKMEMNSDGRSRVMCAKLHVPVEHLGRGKDAFANVTKGYQRADERDVETIDTENNRNVGPLPAFLSGPMKDPKDLEAIEVDTGLGKLKCKGIAGTLEFMDGSQAIKVQMENRLHDKAPFGVASCTMKFNVGDGDDVGTVKLIIDKTGKGAKTELPDSK